MIDLTNQKIFNDIKTRSEDVLTSDDAREAFAFIRNMTDLLAGADSQNLANYPEMLAAYQSLVDKMTFLAVVSLRDNELVDIFKTKLSVGLHLANINLIEKLKSHLLTIPAFASRDKLRQALLAAIGENAEQLGSVAVAIGINKVSPTIANWIKKYAFQTESSQRESLHLNEFISQDKDAQQLTPDDKQALRRLLDLVEFLKLSSQTVEGLEDPVVFDFGGKLRRLNQGKWEDLELDPRLRNIVENLAKIYENNSAVNVAPESTPTNPVRQLAYDKALAATRTMLAQSQGDAKKLFDMLNDSLNRGAAEETVAGLLLLAQLRKLDDILAEDERFRNLVAADLKASGQDDKVDGLRINPTAPNFIARLLKIILQDKLGLAAAEALAFGERLGRMLSVEGDKYSRIVVRGEDGGLRWNL